MKKKFSKELKGKKILVTGAAGFIGSHVARDLAQEGALVHALDVPLSDFARLKKIVSRFRPHQVVHCGAVVNLERSYDLARQCLESNVKGTLNLLESLKGLAVQMLVYLSTAEVYGKSPIPYKEEAKEFPPSPYAITKLAGEHFCRLYADQFSLPVCILRISTCFGPRQNRKRLIPSAILSCLANRKVKISHGRQLRDFLYVKDAVQGIIRALKSKGARNQTINLGSEKSVSIRAITEKIKALTGSRSRIAFGTVPQRAQENERWSSSSEKAKRILHWKPEVSLEDGLRRTIEWYRSHA